MLMRTDQWRDLDRLTEAVFGTTTRPAVMPMDAYRDENTFKVQLDLPGVDVDSIDLTVEQNVLSVHAERRRSLDGTTEQVVSERTYGVFSRQLFLGEALDADHLTAEYSDGVLVIEIPIAEQAKPRKVEIKSGSSHRAINR